MIKKYNYSHLITKKDQNKVIKLVDNLIRSGRWCTTSTIPRYQTWMNLHEYEELKIFTETFLVSCFDYLNRFYPYDIKMWAFRDNRFNNNKKNQLNLWHNHSVEGVKKISGIYYLRNLRNEGTEFENENIVPEPYTWYIYPSHLLHKPPAIKSFRNRYTIAADMEYY